jgi:hypothetical protein
VASVRERLGHNHDGRNTMDTHRHRRDDKREEADCGYHPRRGRRYDSDKD